MTLADEDKIRIAELANVEYVATVEPPKGTPTDVDIAILGHDCEWCATVRRLVAEREQVPTVDALMAEVQARPEGGGVVECDEKALRAVLARLGAK